MGLVRAGWEMTEALTTPMRHNLVDLIVDGLKGIKTSLKEVAGWTGTEFVKPSGPFTHVTDAMIRRTALERLSRTLVPAAVEADYLPSIIGENPAYRTLADALWEFHNSYKYLGSYAERQPNRPDLLRPLLAIQRKLGPDTDPFSTAVHEMSHHIYSEVFTPEMQKTWFKIGKESGHHPNSINSVSLMEDWVEENVISKAEKVRMITDSWATEDLAYTIQDILTPGKSIQARLGMLKGIEDLFDAPGLIDRVAHRLPMEGI